MSEQLPVELVSKTKRLSILTPAEIDDLYLRPQLTEDERISLFELTRAEQTILSSNISIASKVDTIIRLGYFKQKPHFFQFDLTEVPEDVNRHRQVNDLRIKKANFSDFRRKEAQKQHSPKFVLPSPIVNLTLPEKVLEI